MWRRHLYRAAPFTQRLRRGAIYWTRELAALAMVYRPNLLQNAQRLAMRHLHAQIADPEPRGGAQRISSSSDDARWALATC